MAGAHTGELLPVVDLMGISSREDLYPTLAELRRAGPVVKGSVPLTWALTRHSDIAAALRDERFGHQFPREYTTFSMGEGPAADFQQNILLNRDPPDHTRLRALMSKAFRGITVRRLHDHIVDLVDALITPALDRGTFDVIADLALPLPVKVICELLGIDEVDRDEVRAHVADLVSMNPALMQQGVIWLREYVGTMIAERGPDPEGDLVRRMLSAEEGDEALTHDEIIDNALLLFFAGFETTSNLVGNGCVALFDHPAEKQRLWDDPSLAQHAVEEFLRYDSPVPFVQRYVREDVEIGGRTLRERRVAILMLASANHDEDVFEDPERLDIGRTPNPHVGFGGGIHHCLGAMLARVEGEIVFRRMAECFSSFERTETPERRAGSVRSFAAVPVAATAA